MPTSLQLTDLKPPESSSFQHPHIQVYASTAGHDGNKVDKLYAQLQEIIDQIEEGHAGCTKGLEMLKLRAMHRQTGKTFAGPTAMMRQMREISDFQSLQPLTA